VVIAIIGLILGLILPGVSAMWDQRLEAQAETVAAGALRSVQMQARNTGERGLFFYLEDGVQKIAIIESATSVKNPCSSSGPITAQQALADCFEIVSGFDQRFPPPYRVVPATIFSWSDDAINRLDATALGGNRDTNQRHRNFFSIVFGPDGGLIVGRDVLVYDPTGLTGLAPADSTEYYNGSGTPTDFLIASGACLRMIADAAAEGHAAINFPSVAGLLVYDESLFQEIVDPTEPPPGGAATAGLRRQWLQMNGRPYYVSRLTGSVIRGPVGE
jgi:type II secretory pathway pseudopilin PulG